MDTVRSLHTPEALPLGFLARGLTCCGGGGMALGLEIICCIRWRRRSPPPRMGDGGPALITLYSPGTPVQEIGTDPTSGATTDRDAARMTGAVSTRVSDRSDAWRCLSAADAGMWNPAAAGRKGRTCRRP